MPPPWVTHSGGYPSQVLESEISILQGGVGDPFRRDLGDPFRRLRQNYGTTPFLLESARRQAESGTRRLYLVFM